MNMRDIALLRAMGGGSGGGVSSWNDLTDKPFGEESTTAPLEITWDGNTVGLVNVSDMFYKVSDSTPTDDELSLGSVTVMVPDGSIASASVEEAGGVVKISDDCGMVAEGIFVVRASGVLVDEFVFPEPGLYFGCSQGAYVKSLSLPSYTQTVVKKLDNKFIDAEWMAKRVETQEILFPETVLMFEANSINASLEDSSLFTLSSLAAGETYTVVVDGVAYSREAQVLTLYDGEITWYYLGNMAYTNLSANFDDTGEPFVILDTGTTCGISLHPDMTGEHTICVYTGEYSIDKLPNDFLDLDWIPKLGQEQFEGEILPEQTYTWNAVGGGFDFSASGTAKNYDKIKEGDTVIVTWDGTPYECEVKDSGTLAFMGTTTQWVYAGNLGGAIISQGSDLGIPDTGEPFYVSFFMNVGGTSESQCNVTASTEAAIGEHTVSIVAKREVENLPEEFLPESVGSVVIRSSTEGSTKKFKITVDDSGTITATEV